MRIGLIGLGEMGSEIGRSFVENGIEVISVYDGRSRTSKVKRGQVSTESKML